MDWSTGITIIGAGNVANHLGMSFFNAGIKINGIVNRSLDSARDLGKRVGASYSDDFSSILHNTCLVFICVNDDAISGIIEQLDTTLPVIHTSGSVSLDVLKSKFDRCGVFYPFQTFTKNVNTGELNFPVCLEANCDYVKNCLQYLGDQVSKQVVWMDSMKRKELHLSGVMLNNFTNHLMVRAGEYLDRQEIDSGLLIPLLEETVRKLKENPPALVQTGPARRNNKEIISAHLQLLSNYKHLYDIYSVMSQSIIDYYNS